MEALYSNLKEKVKPISSNTDIEAIVSSFSDASPKSEPIPNLEEINSIFKPDSIQNIYTRIQESKTELGEKLRKQIAPLSPLSMAIVFE
jgi:enoyl-CoA hydratase